jgi:hypothetical protein
LREVTVTSSVADIRSAFTLSRVDGRIVEGNTPAGGGDLCNLELPGFGHVIFLHR